MIKNGGRLLRARPAGKLAAARTRDPGHQEDASSNAILPPAFLLPAWTNHHRSRTSEKTVARPSIQQSFGQHTRRHASSYAHAELAPSHDVYTPEWLVDDPSEGPPTPSTSKIVKEPRTSKIYSAAQPVPDTPSRTTEERCDTSVSSKGKAPEGSLQSVALRSTPQSRQRKAGRNTLPRAIENAKAYLAQEGSESRLVATRLDESQFPVTSLPLQLQEVLLKRPTLIPSNAKSPPLLSTEIEIVSQRLTSRYRHACAVLEAIISTKSTKRITLDLAQRLATEDTLQTLLFLSAKSAATLVESLLSFQDSERADFVRLPRIFSDVLLTYMWRDIHFANAQDPSYAGASLLDTHVGQKPLAKNISRSMRRLRMLSSASRLQFLLAHLDAFTSVIRNMTLEDASTPASVFQILDCLQDTHSTGRGAPLISDESLEAILDLCCVPLRHACSFVSSANHAKVKHSLHMQELEQSMARVWEHTCLPFLRCYCAEGSIPQAILTKLESMHSMALQASFPILASRIAIDIFANTAALGGSGMSSNASKGLTSDTLDLCLRSGRLEEAEALLETMTPVLVGDGQEASVYWHHKLRLILKSDHLDAPSFFTRLDTLLKDIERSGHHPDHHFLASLLRYIPTFPASLDKICDLFHSAIGLAQRSQDPPQSQAKSHIHLAARHGDLGLFERGRLEGVQLPWAPLATTSAATTATLSEALDRPDVDCQELLVRATTASQSMRLALLKNQKARAMSAFEQLTTHFESIVLVSDKAHSELLSPARRLLETAKTMWIGAFVRMLSASLQENDLPAAMRVMALGMEKLGSTYVGQQAIRRCFTAACSPTFHRQSQGSLEPPARSTAILDWQTFARMLSLVSSWAEDILEKDRRHVRAAVDLDMTSMQRMRSVLSKGRSANVMAQATAICLVSASSSSQPNGRQQHQGADVLQAMHSILETMTALRVNFKYNAWWEEVERLVWEQLEFRQMSHGDVARWQEDCDHLSGICSQFEMKRLAVSATV